MKHLFLITVLFAFGLSAASGFDGVTEPINQAKIGFTVPGKIDSIWVKEGAFVRKGDTLMNLVKTEEELKARITKITAKDTSGIVSARVKMETYEKDWQVTKKLFETSNSISAEQLWEKEMNFRIAKEEWEAAKVSKSRDSLEYRMARAQLQKQYLLAPFDGEIVSIAKNNSETTISMTPTIVKTL